MPLIQLDVKMLPMKVHYFLFMGGVAPLTSFLPTIAKQLGYSTVVFGAIYSILPILSLISKPIVGGIVDQFRVKKLMFLTFILLTGLTGFSLMFVPEIPLEITAELDCNIETFLNVCLNTTSKSRCNTQRVMSSVEDVKCQLKCENSNKFREEICNQWKFNEYCPAQNSFISNVKNQSKVAQTIRSKSVKNYYNDDYAYLLIDIHMNRTDHEQSCFYFRVNTAQFYFNSSEIVTYSPYCKERVRSKCQVSCSSPTLMDLLTPDTFVGSVLEYKQFWIFFLIVSLFWISQAVVYSLSDSICFDQLGNKPNLYGKQRCWAAIGWGSFSIIAGWLLDLFSSSEVYRNYMPIYFLCFLVLLCSVFVASKLQISETKISTNIFKDVGKLLSEIKVIGFLIWAITFGMCTAMIWNYLLLYIEEVASLYNCSAQGWIKTLQGLAMGVQCFGGEVPLFFWSGWIIKQLGHVNCMSLVLGVFALRFFAYSILTNPVWVLAIELTNGINFGLAYAVLVSYANVIALPGTESTMIGLVSGVFEGVGVSLGSLIGGYCFNAYGGAETFRLFSYGAAIMCTIHLLYQYLLKYNGKLSLPSHNFEEIQNNKSHFNETGFVSGSTEYASPNEAIHMLSDN